MKEDKNSRVNSADAPSGPYGGTSSPSKQGDVADRETGRPEGRTDTAQSTGAGVEEIRQAAYLKCWNPVGDVSQADTFDIVDKVFDYLASQKIIGGGWRTIDTAPRDGTEILVVYPHQNYTRSLVSFDRVHHYWKSKGVCVLGLEEQEPLWCLIPPLPSPPASTGERGE